jgi:hypothetical protein
LLKLHSNGKDSGALQLVKEMVMKMLVLIKNLLLVMKKNYLKTLWE